MLSMLTTTNDPPWKCTRTYFAPSPSVACIASAIFLVVYPVLVNAIVILQGPAARTTLDTRIVFGNSLLPFEKSVPSKGGPCMNNTPYDTNSGEKSHQIGRTGASRRRQAQRSRSHAHGEIPWTSTPSGLRPLTVSPGQHHLVKAGYKTIGVHTTIVHSPCGYSPSLWGRRSA